MLLYRRLQYTTPWEMAKYFLNLESSLYQLQMAHKVATGFNKILLEKFNESLLMKLLLLLEYLVIRLPAPMFELHCMSKPQIPVNNTLASLSMFRFFVSIECLIFALSLMVSKCGVELCMFFTGQNDAY